MVKSLKLNPIWLLLFLGDFSAWNYVIKHYHLINERKEPFLDPKVILVIVINFLNLPACLKELGTDYAWVRNHNNMMRDNFL